MRKFAPILIFVCVLVMLLSACSAKASDPAAKAVENYLTALVNKDSTRLSALSCADWESNALLELDSLQAVQAKLDGLSCTTTIVDGKTSQVNCKGKIIATYNNENQELDLSVRTYQVVQQGGDYLVCGYK
jgi:outer membrane lipoprotein-sorting protein